MPFLTKLSPILSVSSVLTYQFFLHQYAHLKRHFFLTESFIPCWVGWSFCLFPHAGTCGEHHLTVFSKTAHPNSKRNYLQGWSRWGNWNIWTFLRPIPSTKEMSTVIKLFPTVQCRESIYVSYPSHCKNPSGQILSWLRSNFLTASIFLIMQPKLSCDPFKPFHSCTLFQGLFFLPGVTSQSIYREQEHTVSIFVLQAK